MGARIGGDLHGQVDPTVKIRLALVDDSAVALAWAQKNLAAHNFEVLTYHEPFGIQAFVRRASPDIVLLDVKMPALQGDMVCKLLKQHARTRDVVVALYSSMPEGDLRALTGRCMADGYVVKTNDAAELARKLEQLLRASRAPELQ